jgi:endonuclease/exonuclease/phosphatase family metal-dependent hydrolase
VEAVSRHDPAGGDRTRGPATRSRWANRGWLVAGGALVTWVRRRAPRVAAVADPRPRRARSTSAAQRGLFAAAWFVPAARWCSRSPGSDRVLWRAAVAALVLARVALQFTPGGPPSWWSPAWPSPREPWPSSRSRPAAPSGHLARVGIVLGLGLEDGHARGARHLRPGVADRPGRGGRDRGVRRPGAPGRRARRPGPAVVADPPGRLGTLSPVWTRGAAWSWLGVGPAIALVGILVSPAARLEVAGGRAPGRGAAVVGGRRRRLRGGGAGTRPRCADQRRRRGGPGPGDHAPRAPAGGLSSLAGAGRAAGRGGLTLGAPTTPRDDGPRRRGGAVVVPAAVRRDRLRLLRVLRGPAAGGQRRGPGRGGRRPRPARVRRGARPLQLRPTVPRRSEGGGADRRRRGARRRSRRARARQPRARARASATDAASGSRPSTSGRGSTRPDGSTPRARRGDHRQRRGRDRPQRGRPGWLLEGGHDLLRLLADRTGTTATFAPAADELWGNAVLSRLPVTEARVVALPRAGAAMRARWSAWWSTRVAAAPSPSSAPSCTASRRAAARLTHARAVTAEVARLRGRGLPVAVLGDLGAERDAPELAPLTILDDAVAGERPDLAGRRPPVLRRDHVLVSSDLIPTPDGSVPRSACRTTSR